MNKQHKHYQIQMQYYAIKHYILEQENSMEQGKEGWSYDITTDDWILVSCATRV